MTIKKLQRQATTQCKKLHHVLGDWTDHGSEFRNVCTKCKMTVIVTDYPDFPIQPFIGGSAHYIECGTVIANLELPIKETRNVWAGVSGGHYDQITFFKNKPTHFDEDGKVDCLAEYGCENIIGDMCLSEFQELYPKADLSPYLNKDRPKDIEILEVFPVMLSTIWDGDHLRSIRTKVDWL